MINCEHYKNYRGPNLTRAQIWRDNEDKLDITDKINVLDVRNYGLSRVYIAN